MTLLGQLLLWLALLLSVWSALATWLGAKRGQGDLARSGPRAMRAAAAALVAALALLTWALWRLDFNVAYVAAHMSRAVPPLYTWAALYAGPEGALLLCCTAIAVAGALPWGGEDDAWAGRATLSSIVAALAAAALFGLNPFTRLPFTPVEGAGLESRLQTLVGMLAPLFLFFGYATLVVLFAGAVGGLVTGRPEAARARTRRWARVAWPLLSAGVLLGARVSYVQPAAPDPLVALTDLSVAGAAWLLVTVLLHLPNRVGLHPRWTIAAALACGGLALTGSVVEGAGGPMPSALWLGLFVVFGTAVVGAILHPRLSAHAGDGAPLWDDGRAIRHYATHAAHAAAIIIVAASGGAAFAAQVRVVLRPGEAVTIASPLGGSYTVTHLGVSRYERSNQIVTAAALTVSRDGRRLALARAERVLHVDALARPSGEPYPRAGVWTGPLEDLRAVLEATDRSEEITLRLAVVPFMLWIWLGGGLLFVSALAVAIAPTGARSRSRGWID